MTGAAARYQIQAVSKLTGIGIDTLRAWERRYGAVSPQRDGRGRAYNDRDVARLRLLHQGVAAGHSIGQIATLDDPALRRLARPPAPTAPPAVDRTRLRKALQTLDTAAIDRECAWLAAVLPPLALLNDVLMPALREAGERWHEQRGGIAREHVISTTLRNLLGSFLRLHASPAPQSRLLFTTPAGDRHELGILGAAMLAAAHGLGVSYVGPDLPAAEILEAVTITGARVLVLGCTLERAAPTTGRELTTLLRRLPRDIEIWAGGAGAPAHARRLGSRALIFADFDSYQRQLARLAPPR